MAWRVDVALWQWYQYPMASSDVDKHNVSSDVPEASDESPEDDDRCYVNKISTTT